jgi:hypothetical protein
VNNIWSKFWKWYNRHLLLNTSIAAFLFLLQLVHLYWLATHVIALKLLGYSLFSPNPFWQTVIILVDYTEIPALIATSLVYINEYKQKKNFKSILYLLFLNIQLVHIFWITDEFVLDEFSGGSAYVNIPGWLAWIAILIDYLEVPVIIETFKKLYDALSKKDLEKIKEALEEE